VVVKCLLYLKKYCFQVKIVVPNATIGMIIGKGGRYIKQIKDETGAFVQISQKSPDGVLVERVITVAGDCCLLLFMICVFCIHTNLSVMLSCIIAPQWSCYTC